MAGLDSEAMRALLGRQLASISDTLLKASRRRDEELQKRTVSFQKSPAPAVQSLQQPRTEPSLISDTEDGHSDSVGSVIFGSRHTVSAFPAFNNSNLDLLTSKDILDDGTAPSPLYKEYFLSGDDCKNMMARFDPPSPKTNACDDLNAEPTASEHAHDRLPAEDNAPPSSMTMLMDMERPGSLGDSFGLPEAIDIDPKKVLAGFDRDPHAGEITIRNEIDDLDPKRLLAMFEGKLVGADEATDDDPKRMLAEIEGSDSVVPQQEDIGGHERHLSEVNGRRMSNAGTWSSLVVPPASSHVVSLPPPIVHVAGRVESYEIAERQATSNEISEEPNMSSAQATPAVATEYGASIDEAKAMLAEFESTKSSIEHKPAEDKEDSTDALYRRLTNILAPVIGSEDSETDMEDAQSKCTWSASKCKMEVEKPDIPYVVALQLEMAGCNWEHVMGWMTYLFSKGPDGHEARREKKKVIDDASAELDIIIKQTLQEEERLAKIEEEDRLPRRLIVSNVATDALEEDLKEFFFQFGFTLRDVKILPAQDPIRRTKVAHADMFTREAAIHASFMTGHIFGLILNIKLAVEEEG